MGEVTADAGAVMLFCNMLKWRIPFNTGDVAGRNSVPGGAFMTIAPSCVFRLSCSSSLSELSGVGAAEGPCEREPSTV